MLTGLVRVPNVVGLRLVLTEELSPKIVELVQTLVLRRGHPVRLVDAGKSLADALVPSEEAPQPVLPRALVTVPRDRSTVVAELSHAFREVCSAERNVVSTSVLQEIFYRILLGFRHDSPGANPRVHGAHTAQAPLQGGSTHPKGSSM